MKTRHILLIVILILALVFAINLASALTISSVSSSPAEIQPGEKVSLSLEIENNLNDNAEDVVVSLDLNNPQQPVPFAPYQSSSQISYDEIKEDKSKNAEFELITNSNAESGTYKIPVKISYMLNGVEGKSEGLVSLIVNALPKLDVSSDSNLIKGMNNDLTIKIINSGLGGAKLLSLKLNPGTGVKVFGSDSVYMGNIDGDDFDTAEFKIFVDEKASSLLNLRVELNYQDSRNNQLDEEKNLQIRAYSQEEAIRLGLINKSNIAMIIAVIVILVVLFFVYRAIRKRLKKKRLESQEG